MKTKTLVVIILIGLVLFSARNYIKDTVLPYLNGTEESTSEYTEEQQSAIDEFKDGVINVFALMKDNIFSQDELSDMNILDGKKPLESLGELIDNDKSFSVSDIDIDSLNLENLNNEQITMLMKVFSGQMSMTELLTSGTFTFKDLQDMGLFNVIMDNINKSE